MEPAPVPSQACFYNDNERKSGSDTKIVGFVGEAYIHYGQLYVAMSRVADPQHLHFAVNNSVCRKIRNVVYKEIL